MKTKLKLYSILLLVSWAVSKVIDLYYHFPDYLRGFKDGWEAGSSDANAMWDGTAVHTHGPMAEFFISLFSGLAAIAALIFMVIFFFVFIKTIISIHKGKIFEPYIASKFKFLGRMFILYFAIELIGEILNRPFSEFELPTTSLLIGCAMLIVSDVLSKMREMKEEQELTV